MDIASVGAVDLDRFRGRKVLITGHSGFIGAWLSLLMLRVGAQVSGVSLAAPPTDPSLAEAVGLSQKLRSEFSGDIANRRFAGEVIESVDPDIVIHLAAQSIVRVAASEPFTTYHTNVIGTASILDAIAASGNVSDCLCFTTDKVYEPGTKAHREGDALGGYEPYGVSKACADMIASDYRPRLASRDCDLKIIRAGNVIGGGDWAVDRIVPDAWRAWTQSSALELRMPGAVRPWQHVLEVVSACMFLLNRDSDANSAEDGAWNVGPGTEKVTVAELVSSLVGSWSNPPDIIERPVAPEQVGEAPSLVLDSSRIRDAGWLPLFQPDEAIENTGAWYSRYRENPRDALNFTMQQIEHYFGFSS